MISQEIFTQQQKELSQMEVMHIALPPDQGYMLAAVVQAGAMCLDLPNSTDHFCRQFVDAFCDRYRDQMPTVVKGIEIGWQEEEMVTAQEFESIFAVAPPDHDPEDYDY